MNVRAKPRSTIAVCSMGLLLALTLAACGSSTSSTPTTASTSSAGVSTAPATASTDDPYGNALGASPAASVAVNASPATSPDATPSPGTGSATVLVADNATLGAILTTADGMTLYTYAKDTPGTSVCNDQCAVNWPPLLSDAAPSAPEGATGSFGVITRDDGGSQVTYNDMPLYTYIKDTAPGDTTGQDVGDVWYVAQAAPDSGTPTAESDSESGTPVAEGESDGAATTLLVAADATLGNILTGSNSMTLYIYTKDTPGTSVCYDQCALNWPPLIVTDQPTAPDGVTGTLGTTTRTDGSLQVTYNDQPLYYFVGDTAPGDTTGQGVGSVWYVVNP